VSAVPLKLNPDEPRFRILKALLACRGQRAYAQSLFECLDGDVKTPMRLHNTCVSLFRHGLLEKVRGMYQLTPAGAQMVGA
jgi:hypothetical protein